MSTTVLTRGELAVEAYRLRCEGLTLAQITERLAISSTAQTGRLIAKLTTYTNHTCRCGARYIVASWETHDRCSRCRRRKRDRERHCAPRKLACRECGTELRHPHPSGKCGMCGNYQLEVTFDTDATGGNQ